MESNSAVENRSKQFSRQSLFPSGQHHHPSIIVAALKPLQSSSFKRDQRKISNHRAAIVARRRCSLNAFDGLMSPTGLHGRLHRPVQPDSGALGQFTIA
jgi:hypothetical protein